MPDENTENSSSRRKGLKDRLAEFRNRHFPRSSLRWAMLSGASWSVAASVLSRMFAMTTGIILARLIGKAGYGKWGLVLQSVTLFAGFVIKGTTSGGTKYIAELRKTDPQRAGRIVSLLLLAGLFSAVLMSVLCSSLAPVVAVRLFRVPELAGPLILGGLLLLSMVMANTLQGGLAGFRNFRSIAYGNLIQGATTLVLVSPLVTLMGLTGAVVMMTISWLAGALYCLIILLKRCHDHGIHLRLAGITQELSVLWRFFAPGFLMGGLMGPAIVFSQAIVARTPGGVPGLGGFNAAMRWSMLVMFAPIAMRKVTLSVFSEIRGQQNYKRFLRALWANIGLVGGVALMLALPVMALAPWVMGLYGPEFRGDWDMLVLLVGLAVLRAVDNVFSQVAMSHERVWLNFFVHFVWAGLLLSCTYWLVPQHGARGLVYAWVGAGVVKALLGALMTIIIVGRFKTKCVPVEDTYDVPDSAQEMS